MKLSKFILLLASVTCCSLIYVSQQTEIFRLAYAGQKKSAQLRDSLDKNAMLRYNINKNTSLVLIDDRISASKDFEMPASFRVVRVEPGAKGMGAEGSSKLIKLASSFFGIKRQAEAKTIDRR